jgi:hypothetical protein
MAKKPEEPNKPYKPSKPEEAKKEKKSIPLNIIQVPGDKEEMDSEMQDLFNEDKVEHIQGNIEPEAD